MRRLIEYAALATLFGMVPVAAEAQTLFTGSGCSGNQFVFCASWTTTYIDATHISMFITNTSQNAPASNPNSAFTTIGIGNVTVADPASITAVGGWQFVPNILGFSGSGLLENQFGVATTSGILNSLTAGSSLTFAFAFGSSIGTFAQAQTAFSGVQVALRDEGDPPGLDCNASQGVLPGASAGSNNGSASCVTALNVAPEPATIALVATGLIPLVALARRRRTAA